MTVSEIYQLEIEIKHLKLLLEKIEKKCDVTIEYGSYSNEENGELWYAQEIKEMIRGWS